MVGPDHRCRHQPNQDAISLRGWSGGWIAAVADGLGSRQHSGQGSHAAVRAVQHVMRNLAHKGLFRSMPSREVATAVYRRWLDSVGYIDKSEAATTLLFTACDSQGHARSWQLGDGLIICRSQGTFRVLTPERSGFVNETRALGIHRAWSDWTSADVTLHNDGDAIVLMTDGVADELSSSTLPRFTSVLTRQLSSKSKRAGRAWLSRELTGWATPSHTDDKTIAVIYKG